MDLSFYSAFLFDVDKTLTNSKKEISPATKDALQLLVAKDFTIGICTGRHFATIHTLLGSLFSPQVLHVTAGGGEIRASTGEIRFQKNISDEIVRKLSAIAQHYDCRIVLQSSKDMYGNEKAIQEHFSYMLHEGTSQVIQPVTNLKDWSMPIVVILDITDECEREMQALPIGFKPMVNYAGKKYADVTALGVTKATGIQEWCRITGIKPEKIIGFGDSTNDLEFLETVGYGVAMGNATDEVKSIADEVTLDCDNDGVAEWIRRNL